MRAGLLRHRITIQQSTPTQNSFGEPIDSWGTFGTAYAEFAPLSGRESFANQSNQTVAESFVVWKIRYRTGVLPTMRINWNDQGTTRLFDIEGINEVKGRRKELHLTCREILDG